MILKIYSEHFTIRLVLFLLLSTTTVLSLPSAYDKLKFDNLVCFLKKLPTFTLHVIRDFRPCKVPSYNVEGVCTETFTRYKTFSIFSSKTQFYTGFKR